MEALRNNARNLTSGLGTTASNIVYLAVLVVAIVILYYILMFFVGGVKRDEVLLTKKIPVAGQRSSDYTKDYDMVVYENGTTPGTFRAGSEYTVGFWMYVNSYNGGGNGKYQSILSLVDQGSLSTALAYNALDSTANDATGTKNQALLTFGLFPSENKMLVRAGLVGTTSTNLTTDPVSVFLKKKAATGNDEITKFGIDSATYSSSATLQNMTPCDVMDIDLQRWMYVCVSVNGRILDVYLDGKLARSCILPSTQKYSLTGNQTIHLIPSSTSFNGYVSGVHFSSYAVAPDQIYANYQAGPYSSAGFLDFLLEKLNISITYKGADGASKTTTLKDWLV
jgi:hypothetical protein